MNTPSLEQLQEFIVSNNIRRVNDMLMFEGIIHFSKNDSYRILNSDVQIIFLPGSAALYILKFLQEEYDQNEMYSTSAYQFVCTSTKALQISNDTATSKIIISLPPEL